eukprot:2555921-Prymnesium_polylepis.1
MGPLPVRDKAGTDLGELTVEVTALAVLSKLAAVAESGPRLTVKLHELKLKKPEQAALTVTADFFGDAATSAAIKLRGGKGD